jgi:hypothetical protein
MKQMTITYPDGAVLAALLLLRGNATLRAAVPGHNDMSVFTLSKGQWISERGEAVKIEFAWDRQTKGHTPTEVECICSQELATRMLSLLAAGSESDEWIEDLVYEFSADAQGVRISQTRLSAQRQLSD